MKHGFILPDRWIKSIEECSSTVIFVDRNIKLGINRLSRMTFIVLIILNTALAIYLAIKQV